VATNFRIVVEQILALRVPARNLASRHSQWMSVKGLSQRWVEPITEYTALGKRPEACQAWASDGVAWPS
jgi:hypothetical protein